MAQSWRRLRRPRALLSALFVLCTVGGAAATGAMIWADYRDTRADAEARTRYQARLLEEYVCRAVDAADVALRRVVNHAAGPWVSVESLAAQGAAFLQPIADEAAHVDSLYLIDNRGILLLDVRGQLAPGLSVGRRDWVGATLASPAGTLHLGTAMDDWQADRVVFALARAVRDETGRGQGVVAATIHPGDFASLADSAAGPRPILGVYRQDGAVLAAYPWAGGPVGRTPLVQRLFVEYLSHAAAGTFVFTDAEGKETITSYRKAGTHDMVVQASLSVAEVMRPWRQRTVVTLATASLVLALLAALLLLLSREIRRERVVKTALQTANRELSRSNADLEQFAYVASHDLKEPLRNIASYVQLLQRRYQGKLDEDADAFIGYTVDGVRRMQMIINELLVYSRIGTGPLMRGSVQTGVLVSTALTSLKTMIAEAGAAVEVKGPLPVVNGDSGQLASVFQNLLSNGLKYRRDDVRPELTITVADHGEAWCFSVADNGIGIDPQYQRQIFELFKRLHARDRYAGSGIGLAVCQRVIERHGGAIWVESVPGQGATFYFTLPKAVA